MRTTARVGFGPANGGGALARLALGGLALFLAILAVAAGGATLAPPPAGASPCAYSGELRGPPARFVPLYERAAARYRLGERGPAILASIHETESGYGANMGPSSAGAVGQMQFMPATWASYGVDADGDGHKDPYSPADAIHGAANYLHASGAPGDWRAALFAYNHATWYVEQILAGAERLAGSLEIRCQASGEALQVGELDFGDTSGPWAGSKKFADVAKRFARRAGCTVVSAKRDTASTASGGVSDHFSGATHSYAYDLDSCTPREMDETARLIASAFGLPGHSGAITEVRGAYRLQLLWRTYVGGDHYTHVHFGVRRYPGPP